MDHKWVTREGKELLIREMSELHLTNLVRFIESQVLNGSYAHYPAVYFAGKLEFLMRSHPELRNYHELLVSLHEAETEDHDRRMDEVLDDDRD